MLIYPTFYERWADIYVKCTLFIKQNNINNVLFNEYYYETLCGLMYNIYANMLLI